MKTSTSETHRINRRRTSIRIKSEIITRQNDFAAQQCFSLGVRTPPAGKKQHEQSCTPTANLETITFDKILHIQGNTIIIELFGHFDFQNHETVAK